MLIDEAAISELARLASKTDLAASSHWRAFHEGFRYQDGRFAGLRGFGGAVASRGAIHSAAHRFLQKRFRAHGGSFHWFPEHDRILSEIAARQDRVYDLEMLRQALSLGLIREVEQTPSGLVAVIGDGFGSMASLILSAIPTSRVVIANLTKTLLVDLVYCRAAVPGLKLALARDKAEYRAAADDLEVRLIGLPADSSDALSERPLSWAINIASMQEMDPPVVARYFELLREARTKLFYCCNRSEKRLPDGTVTRFEAYPWSPKDQILVDGLCPWHQQYYSLRPPFFRPYDGPLLHRLVKLSPSR